MQNYKQLSYALLPPVIYMKETCQNLLSQGIQYWRPQPTMIRQGPWWSTREPGVAPSASWPPPPSSYRLLQHKQVTWSVWSEAQPASVAINETVMHTKQQITDCGL